MSIRSAANSKLLVMILLAGMTLAAYWRTPYLSFVGYDDNLYVTDNVHIQEGLSAQTIVWALSSMEAANWHPLTWLSHAIDYQLYGVNAAGHHLTNLTIHVANVVLLFWLLQLMTGAIWRSGFVAALFAVHPLNVESVAWIAERKNVLSTLFFVLTVLAYVRYAGRPGWRRYLPVITLFALGLMAKPMLVTLPFVLLLLDYWPLGRYAGSRIEDRATDPGANLADAPNDDRSARDGSCPSRRVAQLVLEKAPLLVLAVGSCVVTFIAQKREGALIPIGARPVSLRLENALMSYARYLEKMVRPAGLALPYPFPPSTPVWQILAAAVVLLSLTGLAIWGMRRCKYLIVGWLWFLGTLIPVIGLVQAGPQAMADRYAYIPLIGVFIMLVWGAAELKRVMRPAISGLLAAVGVCVLVVLGITTIHQTGYWQNDVSLFEHADSVTSNNFTAYDMLGNLLAKHGKFDQAIAEFSRIAENDPSYCKAQSSVGMILVQKGELDEAIIHFRRAIDASPGYSDAYNRLGAAVANQGHTDEAIGYFNKAVEFNPSHPSAYANLGSAYDEKGDANQALRYYVRALELTVSQINQYGARARAAAAQIDYRMGDVLERTGRVAEAVDRYRDALRLDPGYAPATQRLNTLREDAHLNNGNIR